jgi:hypothetical protein
MDTDDEQHIVELADAWAHEQPVREPMRTRETKTRVNPSRDDLRVRRRNRRTGTGGDMATRDQLVRAAAKAPSLTEQARLLDAARQIQDGISAQAAQARELDFADDIVNTTLSPGRVHEFHTAATDWIGFEREVDENWQHKANAEAAAWFGRTSSMVRADAEEFAVQAAGKARQIAGQFDNNAQAAMDNFMAYAEFLRRQAASGLDQIQQTTAPDGVTQKATPLPEDVFDNFAPEINPINEGVSGTEDSNRNPLLQQIMNGGSGDDQGQPEKPGGHSTTDELSWSPPQGMQADTAPGFSDGDPGTPEKGGDRPRYSSLTQGLVAVSHITNMDQWRAQQESSGKAEGGSAALSVQAASGLDQIDQTVDPNNVPKPTGYPGDVAFPLTEPFADEATTGGTGDVHTVRPMARKVEADMYGASDAPHAVVQPEVANSPATTPPSPYGAASAGEEQGRKDAEAGNDAPTFSDASSSVPGFVNGVGEGYETQMKLLQNEQATSTPGSMTGVPGATTHAGAKVSSLIVTAAERQDPEFRKGYGYASRWVPGTRLVTQGSASFEAGLYAGISDNEENQRAFVEAHRAAGMAPRVDHHTALTHRIASKNECPSNGLYLTAATSIELNTTAPNTTPAADGSTPINGRGNPGPLDGQQEAATPGGPSPYNGAPPYGKPVVPTQAQTEPNPADALTGGGNMSTPAQVQAAFRRTVQSSLLAARQGK